MGIFDTLSILIGGYGKKEYDNGEYEGDWKDGKRHGKGKFTWNNGYVYYGEWKNDKRTGIGKIKWHNGSKYEGNFVNGRFEGKGKYRWPDGDVYDGNWEKGKRTGKGLFISRNKDIYEGDFVDGVFNGYGKFKCTDGDIYEGDWKDGKRSGNGKMTFLNGNKYEGEWKNNKINGKGKYEWSNGNTYEGEFVNEERTGKGKFTWLNGDTYEGDFIKGERTGNGIYKWASGHKYEGDWVNGDRVGHGKFKWPNGDLYEGDWKEDLRTGYGKFISFKGGIYEGEFLRGKRTGYGTDKYPNGSIKKGFFENGVLIQEDVDNNSNNTINNILNKINQFNGTTNNNITNSSLNNNIKSQNVNKSNSNNSNAINKQSTNNDLINKKSTNANQNVNTYTENKSNINRNNVNFSSDNKNRNILSTNSYLSNDYYNMQSKFKKIVKDKFFLANYIPVEGDFVVSEKSNSIKLVSKLAGGGEGNIYLTNTDYVCKIFKKEKLNVQKFEKIQRMLNRNLDIEGLCNPIDMVYNNRNEFVGYIMKKAEGIELQKSIFIKQLLLENFPNWKRKDLVELSVTILEKIEHLHESNIIIGDINPLNILVKNSKTVYFVDVDSYQIDDIPCPVGTVNFTSPEIQGNDYKKFLRTFGNEYFSVATLIFMIMLTGKAPYSKQGGGSPYENIKNGEFPYPHKNIDNGIIPRGPWKEIWFSMPDYIRKYFYESFTKDGKFYLEKDRLSVKKWINIMNMYKEDLDNEMFDKEVNYEIFPK